MKKFLILVFITVLISACSLAKATEAPTAVPQLNISDPAKKLEATAAYARILDLATTAMSSRSSSTQTRAQGITGRSLGKLTRILLSSSQMSIAPMNL